MSYDPNPNLTLTLIWTQPANDIACMNHGKASNQFLPALSADTDRRVPNGIRYGEMSLGCADRRCGRGGRKMKER